MGFPLVFLLVVISGHFNITYTLDAVCSPGFSGPSCHKENIALNRPTTQSSTWNMYSASRAVNGNTNTNFDSHSCSHTDNDTQSSWTVILDPDREYNITNVTLYLRDMVARRYKDLRVTVDGVLCDRGKITNTNDTRDEAAPAPNPVLLRCHQPVRGHNVTVHVDNSYLSLCEVQIWVCQDGWFGDNCSERCRCNDTSEVCNKLTGYCRSGCSSGWEGRGCQIACTNKTYGPECSKDCGHCLNSSPCDPVIGSCSNGCDPGWKTQKCDENCGNNTYGPNCSLTCGHCLNASSCDPVVGICSECDPGWETEKCNQSCTNNTYGPGCSEECGNCLNSSQCDPVNGSCSSGCDPGWGKQKCDETCGNNTYGPNCSLTCGHCLNSSSCGPVVGNCSGCDPGWEAETCHSSCSNNTYGPECSEKCGHCLNSSSCDPVNGSCSSGCDPGWIKQKCDETCGNNTYGPNCSLACGHCLNFSPCDPVAGNCSGCDPGWETEKCNQSCSSSTYGPGCSLTCGHCLNSSLCDPVTGSCSSGCDPGWEAGKCDKPCTNNTYGLGCSEECGHCLNSSHCDPVNGSCSSGCDSGWRTEKCDQVETGQTEQNTDVYIPAVAAVCGVVVLLVVTVVIVLFLRRRRKSLKEETTMNINPSKLIEMQRSEDETTADCENASCDIYENSHLYYNCLPPIIEVAELQEYIKQKISQGDFKMEFKRLRYGIAGSHEAGKKPENKPRNRFVGLFPYDNTRVVLTPDGASTWDYINASFVPGFDDKTIYIAAQGPNPETINDFWRMVWQQNVCKIVMLTRLVEMNKKKCHQYWPDGDEVKQFGNITVQITRKIVRADYTIRTFNIKHTDSPVRIVTQYHFTSWPDHDVPDTSVLVSFWRHVKHENTQTDTGPLVIHCSAGVGRTGTFIGLDILYTEAETEGKLNIFKCIAKMREARMNMVQTVDQYQFLHEAVLEALKSRGTFYSLVEFEQKYGLRESFNQNQKEELQKEFQSLQSLRSEFEEEQVSNSLLSENIDKNRSLEILPANANRPFLSPVAGRNDYINAVMLPSVTRPRYYIVSQTPLPDTVIDFWRLVYDHDCFIIVCLEDSPDLSSLVPVETMSTTVGPFEIQNLMVDRNRDTFTVTKLEIQYNQQIECSREVQVYKFFGMTDRQTATAAILQFIEALQHRHAEEEQHMLVMCNDGSRYSGVFCSLMNIVSKLQLDKQVDIFLTIRQLQSIRPQFVQTFDQYKLCYSMVKEYCRASNVYANL